MSMIKDPGSGLILPKQFVDEKVALKKTIDDLVDKVVSQMSHLENYFLTLHARFDKLNPSEFIVSEPKITNKLPQFLSNSFVFWVNNKKSVCELLWMVPPKKKGEKLQPIFNKEGVAYLQAKGAMPKA